MTAPSSDTASMNFNPLIPQYSLSMNESMKFVAVLELFSFGLSFC